MNFEIRNFQETDFPLLRDFYSSTARDKKVIFWWVGPEENWDNVFCAFEEGRMIAKGQVEIISQISHGLPSESKHQIYLNLKALPERETDYHLLNGLYEKLYERALQLKEHLSDQYETLLCVGNFSTETANNQYFLEQKGFLPLNNLYTMSRDLSIPIDDETTLSDDLQWKFWKINSVEEENYYLEAEREIWPDNELGLNRLKEYKAKKHWTSISVWSNENLVASAFAWEEEEGVCIIEDVFVKEKWRRRGIAHFLLTKGLHYLKELGLREAQLMVDTENENALNVYKSVGFTVVEKEERYFIQLK